MANNNTLLYVGAAAAAYFLFLKPSTPGAPSTGLTSLLPGSTSAPVYGINSGVRGGSGDFFTVSNYAACLAAYPNLGNPQYQLQPAEANQYLANYQDLQTGLAQFVAAGGVNGVKFNTMPAAAQYHWTNYGCAEKRIFIPLQPPSTAAYVAPPPVPGTAKSGGSSTAWVGTALQIAGTVAAMLGPGDPQLNDAEAMFLLNSAAIVKNILPFYLQNDSTLVNSISNKMDSLLNQYTI